MERFAVVFVAGLLLSLCFLSFFGFTSMVLAEGADYSIHHVDHQVEVMYSGHVVVHDIVRASGHASDGFLVGFPYEYGAYVLKVVAYSGGDSLPVSLGVPFEGRSGFYGVKIGFPQGFPQVFTVVFVFSNDLVGYDPAIQRFTVDFPVYPSFAKEVNRVNVTLLVPGGAAEVTVKKDDGAVDKTNFAKNNLAAFTYAPATAVFLPRSSLHILDITTLNRRITINAAADVTSLDSYRIINKSPSILASLELSLPIAASDIISRDEFGRALTTRVSSSSALAKVINVNFTSSLNSGESTTVTTEYKLPKISATDATCFAINFDLFPPLNCYVNEAFVTIVPPEGAHFIAPTLPAVDHSVSISREIFQETLSITRKGVTYIDNSSPSETVGQVAYDYDPLWLSFRPTIWIWVLAVTGCMVVAFLWRPKTPEPSPVIPPRLSIGITRDNVKAFTEAYNEKNRLTSDLKLLDARAQKGKIPRRHYKVQRRNMENRIDSLSKSIAELKALFRRAGGNYAALTRQLEVAEAELSETETGTRNVEGRFKRGALSLEDYKKLLADCQRRKEKAEATINGILLRLREETP